MVVTLVCEGACNPTIKAVDALVYQSNRQFGNIVEGTRTTRGDEEIWALQRALKHTPHEMNGQDHARCLVCGTARRYGWTVTVATRRFFGGASQIEEVEQPW